MTTITAALPAPPHTYTPQHPFPYKSWKFWLDCAPWTRNVTSSTNQNDVKLQRAMICCRIIHCSLSLPLKARCLRKTHNLPATYSQKLPGGQTTLCTATLRTLIRCQFNIFSLCCVCPIISKKSFASFSVAYYEVRCIIFHESSF